MFKIYRFYSKPGKRPKFIKTVSTEAIARMHCNDPRTSKPGVYFDGWTAN